MYRRELDGKELVFLHAGYVYQGSFVMFDTQTESEWLHVTGEAVMGPLKRKSIELLPTRLANWKEWKAAHPNTTVYKSRRKWTDTHRQRVTFGKQTSRPKLGLNVVVDHESKLYPYSALEPARVINDVYNKKPVTAVFVPSAECGVAWIRKVDDQVLKLQPVGGEQGVFRLKDRETKTTWHPLTGEAIDGPLKGKQLRPLIAIPIRLTRYRAFYPGGAIYGPDPTRPRLQSDQSNVRLFEWGKGIGVESRLKRDMTVFLWFYEWNMFHARRQGIHTSGSHLFEREVGKDGNLAVIRAPDMALTMKAVKDGVELSLQIKNRNDHEWPAIAGIIPCFNPGAPTDQASRFPIAKLNSQFDNRNTWYVGRAGLAKLNEREIHFSAALRKQIDAAAADGTHPFSFKWPTSDNNAHKGLLIRESTDGRWVMGIAWERFLSVQGHNPWQCMHLCINVGPLEPGESTTVRGRIYLFQGTKEDCLKRYRADFAERDRSD